MSAALPAPEFDLCVTCGVVEDASKLRPCAECDAPMHEGCERDCAACEASFCGACFGPGRVCAGCDADQRERMTLGAR